MRDHRRGFYGRLLCGTAAISLLSAAAARAEGHQTNFNIAPQPLSSALNEFSIQSKTAILFTPELTGKAFSPGLMEVADAETALRRMLVGTELTYSRNGDTFIIMSADDPQSGSAAGDGADSGTVEALIVTAQKREEDIQDVPIAISAFSQEDLTRSQVAGGPDLMTQVPNMTFTKTNFNSYSIQLRGIGTQAISATTDPAVAVAFNNTPFVRNHFFEQEFYDLERVEVLRGPQGTLYGRNATAGVVNVISAKPKFRYEARIAADIANYSSHRLEGMINIPLVDDKAALRIAGAWTKRDGFVTNSLSGEQTDGRDLWSGRVSLAIAPNDRFRADLIYERFEENDDRLRSGKQLCTKDLGPAMIGTTPVPQDANPLAANAGYFSQGCLPSSMYSPEAFQTPNGYSLPYYGPLAAALMPGALYWERDPYASAKQSPDLREIETHIKPEYAAEADLVELQLRFDLSDGLTLSSETGFARDYIFSFQDFNRFNTAPGAFKPYDNNGARLIDGGGVFCDPQIGCTDRLALADIATARSKQFSQEFRLSSDFDGPMNFNLGANFLRYDTEDKYYVFINTLSLYAATGGQTNTTEPWIPGVTDNSECLWKDLNTGSPPPGYVWSSPNRTYALNCVYIDPNNIHNLNDQGRNYFLSKNPYNLLSYAAFGEVYYNLTPDLKVTGGLRWTVDKKTAPQVPSWLLADFSYGTPTRKVIEQEWREPTGRVAIDWKPALGFTDDTLLYASYVRGYKAGGANPPPPITVLPPVGEVGRLGDDILRVSLTHPERFDAEYIDAYEVGTKNTLLDGRLTLNLGGFYYDYTGYQISQIVNRSAVNLNFDAEVWGVELEADWRPAENLRLGLKIGHESTRVADGEQAVDLMDRTAGEPGWVLFKPFPPQSSNCVLPTWLAEMVAGKGGVTTLCTGYIAGLDPITNLPYEPNPDEYLSGGGVVPITPDSNLGEVNIYGYPGFDPASAPNNGEGFAKDLSGNELPNAPKYTATLTVDYTLPLPNDWLATLHTDLYYQSEAWTRIFNTDGYDKIKAYSNINLAAIFTNEDAGWSVMAYIKNVLDRDSITGAFLNSDDTGLTTNVFLTEPRLYGIRVSKSWNGESPLGGLLGGGGALQPFRVELAGQHGPLRSDHTLFAPGATQLFTPEFPYPLGVQEDLDWGGAGSAKFTYQPGGKGLSLSAQVRYGRAYGDAEAHPKQRPTGGYILGGTYYFDPVEGGTLSPVGYNYATTTATNEESHAIVDFIVGQDVGLGGRGSSTLSAGLRYVRLESNSNAELHGRPDVQVPEDDIIIHGIEFHRFHATINSDREFEGAGLTADWEGLVPLLGQPAEVGEVSLALGLGGSVLWGRQTAVVAGEVRGEHKAGVFSFPGFGGVGQHDATPPYETPFAYSRSISVTVPSVDVSLGLSYELGRVRIGGGYRWERYFDAIDGGIEERKTYDRDFHGPYFKVSVGFGG